jgi:hypothetical protein
MGQGRFTSEPLAGQLELHESGGAHGNVCPRVVMTIGMLQQELAATQDAWTIDEP